MENAIREEWGVEPLRIREGGVRLFMLSVQLVFNLTPISLQSIPSVPYLEKEFICHALHLPMGQSTV